MPLTALAFWFVYVGGAGLALVAPLAGVLLYILVYHLSPDTQWWGDSVRAVGLRTSFVVAVATVVGVMLRMPRFRPGARQFARPAHLLPLFVLIALGSLLWGVGVGERSATQAEKLVKVGLFLLILIRCVHTPTHYQWVLLSWIAGVAYIGYQAFHNIGVRISGRLTEGLGGGDFAESGDLAAHLVATLPLIAALLVQARSNWQRGLLLAAGALAFNTIVMTRARSALVGLSVMGLVALWSLPRGWRARGLAFGVLAVVGGLHLTDDGWWHRMNSISMTPADDSAARRLMYWGAAFAMVRDHPLGIGLGNFHTTVQGYLGLHQVRSAHNTYLECLAELGIPGFAVLMLIIGGALRQLDRLRQPGIGSEVHEIRTAGMRWRFDTAWHAAALRAALAGYLGCALFQSRVVGEDFWILLMLTTCLANVAAATTSASADRPAPTAAAPSSRPVAEPRHALCPGH